MFNSEAGLDDGLRDADDEAYQSNEQKWQFWHKVIVICIMNEASIQDDASCW